MFSTPPPPHSERELLQRARQLQGQSVQQLANALGVDLPSSLRDNKGLIGQMLELWLGASAGNRPEADFSGLGVELKSLPIKANGRPAGATFVSRVPQYTGSAIQWRSSSVRKKLQRVLWIPVESARSRTAFSALHIGNPILWSPTAGLEAALQADWEELSELLQLGRAEALHPGMGTWLHVRGLLTPGRNRTTMVERQAFYLRPRFAEHWVLPG